MEKQQETYEFSTRLRLITNGINTGELSFTYMNDNSYLGHVGNYGRDTLIYRITKQNDENLLTVWEFTDGSCRTGFAYENFGDICLHSKNEKIFSCKKYKAKLLGVVIGIIKHYDAECLDKLKPTQDEEITAVCAECRMQINGTPEFIKKAGWVLEEEKVICLPVICSEARNEN